MILTGKSAQDIILMQLTDGQSAGLCVLIAAEMGCISTSIAVMVFRVGLWRES